MDSGLHRSRANLVSCAVGLVWHVKDGVDSEYTESDEEGEDGGRSEALQDNAAQVLLHAP